MSEQRRKSDEMRRGGEVDNTKDGRDGRGVMSETSLEGPEQIPALLVRLDPPDFLPPGESLSVPIDPHRH